jgi:hypothetical protein
MLSSGANIINWSKCYHLVLSRDAIIWDDDNTPFFLFFLKTSLTRESQEGNCRQGIETAVEKKWKARKGGRKDKKGLGGEMEARIETAEEKKRKVGKSVRKAGLYSNRTGWENGAM